MDHSLLNIDYSDFMTKPVNFAEYYRDAHESLPEDMAKPRGRSVVTTTFIDASFATNKKTRKSHSGFPLFVNRAPIVWFSKRQSTVETSTFSAEFMAIESCLNAIESLRFKLRMFGVPFEGPIHVYRDNKRAVLNFIKVEYNVDKNHNSVVYHFICNAVAASILSVAWIDGKENLADTFTKHLLAPTRKYLFGNWMY